MPLTTFDTSNVRSSGTDFPKLKLEGNETARVVLAENGPTFEWVHTLNKPKLSPVTGKALTKEITIQRTGEKKTVFDDEFVGTPICLGSDDILSERGSDPDHCPICKAALDYPDWFNAPQRKFAVHVLKYATKPGTAKVNTPLSMTTFVWRLSEKRFAKIASIIEEFGKAPTETDLVLGPCTNANFQNYEMAGSPTCAKEASDEDRKRAKETFEGSNAGDLSQYCGRKTDVKYIRQDVEEIIARWQKIAAAENGSAAAVEEPDFSGTLSASGSSLIEGQAQSKPADVPSASLDDLDSTIGGSETPSDPLDEFKPAPAGESTTPQKQSTSFNDLLSRLGD